MRQEVAKQNNEEAGERNAIDGFQKQGKGKEMNEQGEDEKRGQPAERDGETAARGVFGVVGTNHSRGKRSGAKNFINFCG